MEPLKDSISGNGIGFPERNSRSPWELSRWTACAEPVPIMSATLPETILEFIRIWQSILLHGKPVTWKAGTIRFDIPAGTWTVKALVNIVSHGLDFSQAVYELQTAGSFNERFTVLPGFDNNFSPTMDQTITLQQGQPLYLKMHTADRDNSILFLNAVELIRA